MLNTLSDAQLKHNSIIMIEEKSAEELAGESADAHTAAEGGVVQLDETENIRTVIANIAGFDDFQRFQVNLDWTLTELLVFLSQQFELDGDRRLRDLTGDKIYYKEEMENKLKNYEVFREGGTRVQIELGRPCTMAEITVNVIRHKKPEDFKQFYFNADITIKDAKIEICKAFDAELKPEKLTLYRVDAFEEPRIPLRRVNIAFSKQNVSSGELLILKSDQDLSPNEKFKMGIHMTATGLSTDSQYLEDIEVPRELTLAELKDMLLDLASLAPYAANLDNHAFIRIREK